MKVRRGMEGNSLGKGFYVGLELELGFFCGVGVWVVLGRVRG